MSAGPDQDAFSTIENQRRRGPSASACFRQNSISVLRLKMRNRRRLARSRAGSKRLGPLSGQNNASRCSPKRWQKSVRSASGQRTRFQLRRPSEREVGVCCKPLLGSGAQRAASPLGDSLLSGRSFLFRYGQELLRRLLGRSAQKLCPLPQLGRVAVELLATHPTEVGKSLPRKRRARHVKTFSAGRGSGTRRRHSCPE